MCKSASRKTLLANWGVGIGFTVEALCCKSVSEPGGNLVTDNGEGLMDYSPMIQMERGHRQRGL